MKTNDLNALLRGNRYAGRGIVIGLSEDGKRAAMAYFIMGRSENSRNRVFAQKDGGIIIYPFQPEKMKEPELVVYSPVRTYENQLIVTNGDQTDTIYDFLSQGKSFEAALDTRCFEPDAPHFTPRISGMLTFADGGFTYKMNILKSGDEVGSCCYRQTFAYGAIPGVGHFLHTYMRDGNPLPTFEGEPQRVAVPNDIDEFAQGIWESLDSDNRISLYVRSISLKDGSYNDVLINKNVREEQK